ncbi:hypothetical protein MKY41_01915 [Sporosarcina sp. FSL W7-1349]|uniref:PilW family protein n=1 Tax=Sporosarcina sp. FSL W7-1349 TaxID=2921561 RepID=UPI0030F67A02
MKKNEDGITLVELLASLILVSMVVVLIWTTFFISARHNTSETTKMRLQQEANYILTAIQQQHRQKECYDLIVAVEELKIKDCDSNEETTLSSGYIYKLYPENPTDIRPKEQDLELTLIIKDGKENSRLQVEVESTISRYKS